MPRLSRGRQKIEIKKMEKESNLLVTFSKRRSGIFKKASELCTLCGVEIAIIVFSPGSKVFTFGHPSVEELVDRYPNPKPNPNPNPNPGTAEHVQAQRNLTIHDLNMQLTNLLNHLELEKKRGDAFSNMRKESAARCWWEGPTEGLGVQELEQVKLALTELKKKVATQFEKMQLEGQGLSTGGPSFMGVGQGPSTGGPYSMGVGQGQSSGGPYFMAAGQGPSIGGSHFMGTGPAGGGQSITAFPPQFPEAGHAGITFPAQVPHQGVNSSELGLSLTTHGYALGYNHGQQRG